jgi:hypothetical protein
VNTYTVTWVDLHQPPALGPTTSTSRTHSLSFMDDNDRKCKSLVRALQAHEGIIQVEATVEVEHHKTLDENGNWT